MNHETEENREKKFRSWLKRQTNKKGKKFAESTIGNYCSGLRNVTKRLGLGNEVHENLFKYTSYAELEAAFQKIQKASNYEEVNKIESHGMYNTSINYYLKFLKEREQQDSDTPPQIENIQEETQELDPVDTTESDSKYSKDDFLREVYIDDKSYDALTAILLRKKNIVLQGAPGVGKTFAAKRLAFSIMGEKDTNRVQVVQFHQSYSYEDFVIGLRPTENGGFSLHEGPFYKFCMDATEDSANEYFFIIDEINRGNLSKIFGELLMLIEGDKRGEEYATRLLYKDEPFSIPENVFIIGMMNTADRSLAIIDYALRRRFAFFEMKPAFQSALFKEYQKAKNNPKFNKLIETIESLNKTISEDNSLGTGFQIGHSYFCTKSNIDDAWLSSVIEYELIPLLNEYWFDETSKAENWAKNLRDSIKNG